MATALRITGIAPFWSPPLSIARARSLSVSCDVDVHGAVQPLLLLERLAQGALCIRVAAFLLEQLAESMQTLGQFGAALGVIGTSGLDGDRFAVGLLGGIVLGLHS